MSETTICNQSLGRIGAKRINDFDDATDTKTEAILCRLHYAQTRDALQRSHFWVFNKVRAQLSQDTNDPAFEYNNQFLLPSDFLRFRYKSDQGADLNAISVYSNSIETNVNGNRIILSNDSAMNIIYSSLVTDTAKFDPLYIEVLVLKLARKLSVPISGDDKMLAGIDDDLKPLMAQVRALDRNEGAGTRQNEQFTWNDARLMGMGRARPTVASS